MYMVVGGWVCARACVCVGVCMCVIGIHVYGCWGEGLEAELTFGYNHALKHVLFSTYHISNINYLQI